VYNIKLILEYDGTSYHGWQKQPGFLTIQEVIERNLYSLVKEEIKVTAAGRTDAGVHAKGQVINFITSTSIPCFAIKYALNSRLPKDIRVKKAERVPLDFNARKSALSRLYRYIIYNSVFHSPFYRNFTWHIPFPLKIDKMSKACQLLIGRYDFSSFQSQGSPTFSSIREIKKFVLFKKGKFIIAYIKADSFLYKMVRNMMGTLIEVGKGKIPFSEINSILEAKNRRFAGPTTAPPQGLYLVRVNYK